MGGREVSLGANDPITLAGVCSRDILDSRYIERWNAHKVDTQHLGLPAHGPVKQGDEEAVLHHEMELTSDAIRGKVEWSADTARMGHRS